MIHRPRRAPLEHTHVHLVRSARRRSPRRVHGWHVHECGDLARRRLAIVGVPRAALDARMAAQRQAQAHARQSVMLQPGIYSYDHFHALRSSLPAVMAVRA